MRRGISQTLQAIECGMLAALLNGVSSGEVKRRGWCSYQYAKCHKDTALILGVTVKALSEWEAW